MRQSRMYEDENREQWTVDQSTQAGAGLSELTLVALIFRHVKSGRLRTVGGVSPNWHDEDVLAQAFRDSKEQPR